MPVLTYLDPLDLDAMKNILTEPKNSLVKQYEMLFELEGVQLEITDDAIAYIAEKALDFGLGARGLRSICEAIMTDAMFELPSQEEVKEFTVTKAYAEEKLSRSRLTQLKAA
jgi:ATP-dependent Clp protease ATP-binding subunit ClpX